MSNGGYEKGKIKVVWIDREPGKIYSKMFENIDDAVKFGEKKVDFIIFSLVHQEGMEEFEWRLLPYGKFRLYLSFVSSYLKTRITPSFAQSLKRIFFS